MEEKKKQLFQNQQLAYLKTGIVGYLTKIEQWFKPGVKLTLIARHPENDNADVLVTSDDALDVVRVLFRNSLTDKKRLLDQLEKFEPCGKDDKLIPLSAIEKLFTGPPLDLEVDLTQIPKDKAVLQACDIEIVRQAVEIIKLWHGLENGESEELFKIYYKGSPEMQPIREVLGPEYTPVK